MFKFAEKLTKSVISISVPNKGTLNKYLILSYLILKIKILHRTDTEDLQTNSHWMLRCTLTIK